MSTTPTRTIAACAVLLSCAHAPRHVDTPFVRALARVDESPVAFDFAGFPVESDALGHTREDRQAFGRTAPLDAGDFRLVFGQGSGLRGFDTLTIEADGRATLVFGGESSGRWWKSAFRLATTEMRALREKMVALQVMSLQAGYFADVMDGAQWYVAIRAGGRTKTIYCDNHFPEPVVALSTFIRTRVLVPHTRDLELVTETDPVRWNPRP